MQLPLLFRKKISHLIWRGIYSVLVTIYKYNENNSLFQRQCPYRFRSLGSKYSYAINDMLYALFISVLGYQWFVVYFARHMSLFVSNFWQILRQFLRKERKVILLYFDVHLQRYNLQQGIGAWSEYHFQNVLHII